MYLYLIAQGPELSMDVKLLRPGHFTRPLELNQQGAAAGQPKDPVRVARVARRDQLGPDDTKVLPHQSAGGLFNPAF